MKTLKAFFSKYSLTDGQNRLVEHFETFLSDSSHCFILKGYAGTGKTFMMQGLTEYLNEIGRNFRIAAPTGRAAKVISQKTKHRAYTIHKTIYSNEDLKEYKIKNEDGTETFKFYFELKNNEDPSNTIYIIDEASMISNVYAEAEFFRFGTGHLLNDLIKYINLDHNDHNKKILFIGDNAQLPPYNMKFSPALDYNYLLNNCCIKSEEFELTDVVRQNTESGILLNATNLRTSLKENVFNKLQIDTNFNDINPTNYHQLLSDYLKACKNSIDDETIIIAYSNESVKEYNDMIRNHFFPNQKTIAKNDKVILVNNNYNYPELELMNGDFGIVKEVSENNEIRQISLVRKNKEGENQEILVPLMFRSVIIEFTDVYLTKHNIECKIIENILYSDKRDLSSDEMKALYIDFKIRNPNLKSGTTEFKNAIRSDKYFNALRIKFGYAVTCHKAQGGEWKNTFLYCKTNIGFFNSSYYRWLYTGITRAKESLFLLEYPNFSIDSGQILPNISNLKISENIIVFDIDDSEFELSFDFPKDKPFAKQIYIAIIELIKDHNITIENIKNDSYIEHYTFSRGLEQVKFIINYNSKNKISTIQKPKLTSEFVEEIFSAISVLINKTIVFEKNEEINDKQEFQFDKEYQKEFYQKINEKLEANGFKIIKIEHHNYHEIYEIHKGGFVATYRFWYDGNNRFKKTDVIPSKTTGFIEEINELLGEKVY